MEISRIHKAKIRKPGTMPAYGFALTYLNLTNTINNYPGTARNKPSDASRTGTFRAV